MSLRCSALGEKSEGTFMTSFGLQMFNSKIEMSVDEEGEVSGKPLLPFCPTRGSYIAMCEASY